MVPVCGDLLMSEQAWNKTGTWQWGGNRLRAVEWVGGSLGDSLGGVSVLQVTCLCNCPPIGQTLAGGGDV